ncbi:MAG: type I-E CRISPR-associated protein Cas5/CasD [Holophagales bacterium]|nr:type I-E CRISPR-associated protein Cas5/CasD [Holophagales bacterium]
MNKDHLILRLNAPLMSFGGVVIDNFGETDDWPSASLLVGMIGNALGYRRTDREDLQALQDRLVFACRADCEGERLRDFQVADLNKNDKGWTTHGQPEGRAGGANTYIGKHLRYRFYWTDRVITVALRLEPTEGEPSLDQVAKALDYPARPLFIGRKPCLPTAPLLVGRGRGESALDAVAKAPLLDAKDQRQAAHTAFAPVYDAPHPFVGDQYREVQVSGRRNWVSDVHGGEQRWLEGRLAISTEDTP